MLSHEFWQSADGHSSTVGRDQQELLTDTVVGTSYQLMEHDFKQSKGVQNQLKISFLNTIPK